MNKKMLGMLVLAALMLSVVACAPTPATTQTRAATIVSSSAKPSQVIIGLDPDYTTFDPARTYEMESPIVINAVYDSLMIFQGGSITNPTPGVAESYKVSTDGKQYTFTLRKGVKFTSGNPMTSKDVQWSFERAKNIKGNPSFLLDGVQSVETPDDLTVVINLSAPDGAFLYKLTSQPFAILDSATVKQHGGVADATAVTADTANDWLTSNSAGSGPYILQSYSPNNQVVLVKNNNYWGTPAAVDKVILSTMKDSNTQMMALAKGDIDMADSLDYDQIKQLQGKPNIEIKNYNTLSMMFLMCNEDPTIGGPMANVDVQNAIRYALDYKGIQSIIGEGTITPPAMIQMGFLGALPPLDPGFTDLVKAKALMTKAGYPQGFNVTLDTITLSTGGVKWETMAQKVQADLSKIGINVEIKTMDSTVGYTSYRAGKMGFAINAWGPDYTDANNQLAFSPDGYVGLRANWTSALAPDLAALSQKALVTLDQNQRAELLKQIQTDMTTNSPFIPLAQFPQWIATKTGLKGAEHTDAYQIDLRGISW
jgi:peptide/nickel transport system substrate-binding protein